MLPVPRHILFLATALALAAGTAAAQEVRPPSPPPAENLRAARSAPPPSSLSDSVRRVQRETGGRILGAERVPYDGRDINRVKYMDERGRVRYMDDAPSPRSAPRVPRPTERPPHGDNP